MIHQPGCDCGAYACELRAKNVSVQPGHARHAPYKGTPESQSKQAGLNAGVAGEHRAGGTFMPYLAPDSNGQLQKVPIKRGRETRHTIRETRRAQHDRAVSAGHHH